jgi:hypothetical protein
VIDERNDGLVPRNSLRYCMARRVKIVPTEFFEVSDRFVSCKTLVVT